MSDTPESVKRDPLETLWRLENNWRKLADQTRRKEGPEKAAPYHNTAVDLALIAQEIERLRAVTKPLPKFKGEDISDLPPSLQKELSVTKTDELEDQLFTLIKAAGGEADIDTLLVGLWRRFKVEQTRRFIQNKLWRMTQKEILWSLPGKKGVYSATEPEEVAKRESVSRRDIDDLIGDVPPQEDNDIPF